MAETTLHLFPKSRHASLSGDYRTISCYNVIYKFLSEKLPDRMTNILLHIINPAQGGFSRGRNIVDNVLLCHEIICGYQRKHISPRMCIKADLKKAYDSVNWSFLQDYLLQLGFTETFVTWIISCVNNPWFSLNINGTLDGFFKSNTSLRQGVRYHHYYSSW